MKNQKFKLSKASIKELSAKELGKIYAGGSGDTQSTGTTTSASNSLNVETEQITETEYE